MNATLKGDTVTLTLTVSDVTVLLLGSKDVAREIRQTLEEALHPQTGPEAHTALIRKAICTPSAH